MITFVLAAYRSFMDNRCVAICDSGAGGLSVLKILRQKYDKENFVLLSDNRNMPYGDKTEEEMTAIAQSVIKRALSFAPKLVIAACNTLSVTLDKINLDYGVKIIKTLPKIGNGKGYLFCTPFTAGSSFVNKFAVGKAEIVPLKSLASAVERAVRSGEEPHIDRESYDRLCTLGKKVDFISLGCTHYSFVAEEFKKIFPRAEILDGTTETVRKSCDFLSQNSANRPFGEIYIHDEELKIAFNARSE